MTTKQPCADCGKDLTNTNWIWSRSDNKTRCLPCYETKYPGTIATHNLQDLLPP